MRKGVDVWSEAKQVELRQVLHGRARLGVVEQVWSGGAELG